MKTQSELKAYLLATIPTTPVGLVAQTAKQFSISKMTVIRCLAKLIDEEKITKTGATNNTRYHLVDTQEQVLHLKITQTLDEYSIWQQYFERQLADFPEDQLEILQYVVTEMINNAKDHSEGSKLTIKFQVTPKIFTCSIQDNGIGIIKKLQNFLSVKHSQECLFALSKGKLTTDPTKHSGEGIFFSSKVVEYFKIKANCYCYTKDNVAHDWYFESIPFQKGTEINFTLNRNCQTKLVNIFNKFSNPETYKFDKTEILVSLAKLDSERLISRSQAKRLLKNLDQFDRITLDFQAIKSVGQGFVDEVFRVYQNQRPHCELCFINANENIQFMINRGLATFG